MKETINKDILDYYIDHTDQKFDILRLQLERIEEQIEDLNGFKWKLTGIAIAIFSLNAVIEVFRIFGKIGAQ